MLSLYHNTSDNRVLNKSINKITDIAVYQKFNKDVISPTYIIGYSDVSSTANYLYDTDTKRYYYINEISETEGGELMLTCEVDVRMSHRDEIRNLVTTVDRNETKKNGYLNDPLYQCYAYEQIVAKKFPRAIEDDSIILMTIG